MPLENFIAEMRTHDCLTEPAEVLEALVKKSSVQGNRDTRALLRAMEWIASRTDRSLVERLEQMERLAKIKTPVVMSMSAFTGWN
jgi:hypothetical protein